MSFPVLFSAYVYVAFLPSLIAKYRIHAVTNLFIPYRYWKITSPEKYTSRLKDHWSQLYWTWLNRTHPTESTNGSLISPGTDSSIIPEATAALPGVTPCFFRNERRTSLTFSFPLQFSAWLQGAETTVKKKQNIGLHLRHLAQGTGRKLEFEHRVLT